MSAQNSVERLRNIAIVAHVDHGKTTLVDQLLKQSGTLNERAVVPDRVMDSNDLEKERGITILSKNTAIRWTNPKTGEQWRINIVDTPGHADFGGEVERVLSMVDSVLILVDAMDGPMPQTRFVTQKAFAMGFKPIVVVNKVDRPGARASWVLDQTFDLFDRLGATDDQLDFTTVYASGLQGYAGMTEDVRSGDMTPLFEAICEHVPAPPVDPDGPFQMRVTSLDYNNYVGIIGVGRIQRGKVRTNQQVVVIDREGKTRNGKVLQVLGFMGLERVEVSEAQAGDIIAFSGIEGIGISDTLCATDAVEQLPVLAVDEPTISMTFQVNDSPFAGVKERSGGKFLTSRQLRDRLTRETQHNVALKVEDTQDADKFKVSGRGELHLSILIETMRREGFELCVGRPRVLFRADPTTGERLEPIEEVVVDVDEEYAGVVVEKLTARRAELKDLRPAGAGKQRIVFHAPSRALIGYHGEFLTDTRGTGVLNRVFAAYGPFKGAIQQRHTGVLVSSELGESTAYALFNLEDRGPLFIGPGEKIYPGMIIGEHTRGNDLDVNPLRAKKLTNIRAAGKDDNILLTPPVRMTLERSIAYVADDELVEVTPKAIRLRKRFLDANDRKRQARQKEVA